MTDLVQASSSETSCSTWAQEDYVITLTVHGVVVRMTRHSPDADEGTCWTYATASLANREIKCREELLDRCGWARVASDYRTPSERKIVLEVDTRW